MIAEQGPFLEAGMGLREAGWQCRTCARARLSVRSTNVKWICLGSLAVVGRSHCRKSSHATNTGRSPSRRAVTSATRRMVRELAVGSGPRQQRQQVLAVVLQLGLADAVDGAELVHALRA